MPDFIKSSKNWINQQDVRLKQLIENKEYLISRIKLEEEELQYLRKDIEYSKLWIDKTKKDLNKYIKDNIVINKGQKIQALKSIEREEKDTFIIRTYISVGRVYEVIDLYRDCIVVNDNMREMFYFNIDGIGDTFKLID